MSQQDLLYTKEDGVGRIVMNRPAQMNSMSQGLLQGLEEAFLDAGKDDQVRAVVLTGVGEAFSAGGDMGVLKEWSQSSATVVYRHMKAVGELVLKVFSLPKPLITAVNGVAVGGGCSLALCGDVILASDRARFGMVFSRHNLGPDMGASFLLPRLVGMLRAKDLIYSGRLISAQDALSYGMVSEVLPHEDLDTAAMERARKMATWATQAIGLGKTLLHQSAAGGDMATALELEAQAQAILFNSQDAREAIQAFLEKRKPVFQNR
jgi:2-(1,2-epoxy-1,2-dihydrophenyl)acetyl-CoA isomerase